MVLLDARSLVVNVERRNHAAGDHASPEHAGRALRHPSFEDQLHLLRSTHIQIFTNYLLKEDATADRPVQHLRERKLDLQDGKIVSVARFAIRACKRVRRTSKPLPQERVNALGGQTVANGLQPARPCAGEHSVVQTLAGRQDPPYVDLSRSSPAEFRSPPRIVRCC